MTKSATHAQAERFPVLENPPIVEVVCGFVFEPIDLDGLVLGVYWDERAYSGRI